MKILYVLICEDASARPDGRVDVHGVFHQLYAPGFPAQQDRMMLALAIEWDAAEEGRVQFGIDLLDPAGSPAFTISAHTDVSPPEDGQVPPQTRLLMPLEDVVFPRAGTYEFEVRVGEERRRTTPLHLVHNPEAA